jgi:hypothetical protein
MTSTYDSSNPTNKQHHETLIAVVAAVCFVALVFVRQAPRLPKPGPEHQKLAMRFEPQDRGADSRIDGPVAGVNGSRLCGLSTGKHNDEGPQCGGYRVLEARRLGEHHGADV